MTYPAAERVDYTAGVFASLVAEVVFMSMVAVVAALRGMDPWMVVRVPASFLIGPNAVQPPGFVAGDVALGLMLHILLAVIVGLIYAALLPRLGLHPVTGGIITGAILYVLGFWLLPLLFPDWLAPFRLPPTDMVLQALAHAAYGVTLGLVYGRLAARSG